MIRNFAFFTAAIIQYFVFEVTQLGVIFQTIMLHRKKPLIKKMDAVENAKQG